MANAELRAKLQAAQEQLTALGAPFELVDAQLGGHTVRLFKHVPLHLLEMMAPARAFGEREFIVFGSERWTFKRFFDEVDALAAQLATRMGVRKGQRVAIAMRNRPEWLASFLAALSLGAIVAPLNSWGRREELLHGLKDSAATVYICDPERLAWVADDLAALEVTSIVTDAPLTAAESKVLRYVDLVAIPAAPVEVELGPDDDALLLYTSGTTSHAKGALSTHGAICQALRNFEYQGAVAGITSMESVKAIMALGFAPTTLTAVPLFHVSGLHVQFLFSLRNGRRIVMMRKWDPEEALRLIATERVTTFSGSPAMVLQLLDSPSFASSDSSSLTSIGLGGSSVTQRTIDLIASLKPLALSGIGYGLTETNGVGSACTGSAFLYKPASSGLLSPIIEVATVNAAGELLPAGETGEIWLRGATLMTSYWRNAEATAEVMSDGWFSSGDIGYVDEEGYLFIVDRIKDIVNRGGEKIATAEVEFCVSAHPAVFEAAAFGVPDELLGEALVLVVYLCAGSTTSESELRDFLAQHLAVFKVPSRILIFPTELPRNPSGKLLKRELRALAIRGMGGDT